MISVSPTLLAEFGKGEWFRHITYLLFSSLHGEHIENVLGENIKKVTMVKIM